MAYPFLSAGLNSCRPSVLIYLLIGCQARKCIAEPSDPWTGQSHRTPAQL